MMHKQINISYLDIIHNYSQLMMYYYTTLI